MSQDKREKGLDIIGKLWGEELAKNPPPFPEPLNEYSIEHLFGTVWANDDMSLPDRSLATCTMLIALNRQEEMKVHFVAAKNLGVERGKLIAIIAQAAHYAGWPNAVTAGRIIAEVWPE